MVIGDAKLTYIKNWKEIRHEAIIEIVNLEVKVYIIITLLLWIRTGFVVVRANS